MSSKNVFPTIVAGVLGVWLALNIASVKAASPSIVITNLPVYGTHGNLSGVVSNASPATHCLVVFIYVAGDWYSKPGCTNQLTPIQPDGSWTVNIAPNANDVNAIEIAVFLVPTNYNRACVNGSPALTIPPEAEAQIYVNRVNPRARQFSFSGYKWSVKTSSGGLSGPGPNHFSDSTNNVWVDAQGFLHLKIAYTNDGWQCAEIVSERNFGYGQYRFAVHTSINNLDANAILGLFTYSFESAYDDREIDIELSRWNYAFGATNVEDYAIAPYNDGQLLRFPVRTGVTNSTQSFIWQSNRVSFQSLNGDFASPPDATNVLESWSTSVGVPPAGGEQVHINLWLDHGNPPANGQPVEVVIPQFEFVPLGPPAPAQLGQLTGLPYGPIRLDAKGVADWHYQILASSNLLNWLKLETVLATNDFFGFTDTNPISATPRFYRIQTEP